MNYSSKQRQPSRVFSLSIYLDVYGSMIQQFSMCDQEPCYIILLVRHLCNVSLHDLHKNFATLFTQQLTTGTVGSSSPPTKELPSLPSLQYMLMYTPLRTKSVLKSIFSKKLYCFTISRRVKNVFILNVDSELLCLLSNI